MLGQWVKEAQKIFFCFTRGLINYSLIAGLFTLQPVRDINSQIFWQIKLRQLPHQTRTKKTNNIN